MGNQIKATKYMLDDNEDILREMSTKGADIGKEGMRITASAIRSGFGGSIIYCKHCGKNIDADSAFCKSCGKKQ